MLGMAVGTVGTLVGVGGGFILLPILVILYPDISHENLAAVTMIVILANSISGVFACNKKGRINYKAGLLFSITAVPAAVIGSYFTSYIPLVFFKILLGIVMIIVSILLVTGKKKSDKNKIKKINSKYILTGRISEPNKEKVVWSYDFRIGMIFSFIASFIASILGIGGGVFHVPAMVKFMRFPIIAAAATSQFIIVFMSIASIFTHVVSGNFNQGIDLGIIISIGAVPGAFLGSKISSLINNNRIVVIFSIIMAFIGMKSLVTVFFKI
ncbi:MAG: sulfite exporter TauE/SafE family protein [Clostridiales bacterium]